MMIIFPKVGFDNNITHFDKTNIKLTIRIKQNSTVGSEK